LLRQKFPAPALLILSVYEDDDRIFNALCAGASGYLLKKTPPARLLESMREVLEGGAPMSPDIARRVLKLFRDTRPPSAVTMTLRHMNCACSSYWWKAITTAARLLNWA
jgi:DNA-binding NarL/FixJ family response regulator